MRWLNNTLGWLSVYGKPWPVPLYALKLGAWLFPVKACGWCTFHRCYILCWQGIVVSEMGSPFINGVPAITMQVVLTWRGKLKRRLHPSLG